MKLGERSTRRIGAIELRQARQRHLRHVRYLNGIRLGSVVLHAGRQFLANARLAGLKAGCLRVRSSQERLMKAVHGLMIVCRTGFIGHLILMIW